MEMCCRQTSIFKGVLTFSVPSSRRLPRDPSWGFGAPVNQCTLHGLKTENGVEYITKSRKAAGDVSKAEVFDELLKHAPEKLDAVKEVLLKFVNRHIQKLGLNVKDANSQFADGVILLLLIGELEGYFLNLGDFFLNPSSTSEMVHNVNLAVDLLLDGGLINNPINPEDIVNQDTKATLLVLYGLFCRYKTKET